MANDAVKNALRNEGAVDFGLRLLRTDDPPKDLRVPANRSGRQNRTYELGGPVIDTIEVKPAELQATLDVIPAHTWYALPSGALAFVNERTADHLGIAKDHPLRFGIDIHGGWDSHIPLLHPGDHEETRRVWATCLRTGCAGEVSFLVPKGEGGYRWFFSRAEPLRANDGTLLGWIGVNLEIDERKRAEFYLAEAQRLAHIASWAWQVSGGRALHLSEQWYRMFGFDPKKGMPRWEERLQRVYPEDRGKWQGTIERAIRERSDYELE